MVDPRKMTMKKSKLRIRKLRCPRLHLSGKLQKLTVFIAFVYNLDTAVHDCISEEALIHLRTYKYSSVDRSLISRYVLQHYVPSLLPSHIYWEAE